MRPSLHAIAGSLIIIALGAAWLLNTMGVFPDINWIWTLGLALSGLVILGAGGLNRTTIVAGPLLLIASVLSVLRQTNKLNFNQEVPILVIVLGILILIAQFTPLSPAGAAPPRR
jgi:hypothetical protein